MAQKNYRPGGLGAMMDIYENVTADFINFLATIPEEAYLKERPKQIEYLRSIQMIMLHIVRAAYGYANSIRGALTIAVTVERPTELQHLDDAAMSLKEALRYTEVSLAGKWEMSDDDLDRTMMDSSWGVPYSIEQMMEHAIVHILRHRRHIERILEE